MAVAVSGKYPIIRQPAKSLEFIDDAKAAEIDSTFPGARRRESADAALQSAAVRGCLHRATAGSPTSILEAAARRASAPRAVCPSAVGRRSPAKANDARDRCRSARFDQRRRRCPSGGLPSREALI